ncbi:hypothetical protein ACF0H5_024348 [Mactra antiquata]
MANAQTDRDKHVGDFCQPCLEKSVRRNADFYCSTCSEFQCKECSNVHEIYKFMRNHKIMSVIEGQTHVSSTDYDEEEFIASDKCKTHNKPFVFYCQQDETLLCSNCAITNHKMCGTVVGIERMNGNDRCAKLRDKLVAAIHSTKQDTELIDETDKCLSDDTLALQDKLKDTKARIMQIFDDFTYAILTDASAYRDKTKEDLARKKGRCETKIKSLEKTLTTIESIMRTGTPAEQFLTEQRMIEDVNHIVKDVHLLHEDISKIDVNLKFGDHFKKLTSDFSSLVQDQEKFDIKCRPLQPSTLTLSCSINLKPSHDDVGEPRYSGLTFLADRRLVVTDNKNGKCLLYDVNLSVKNSYKLPYNHPACVTAVSDDEVVVTSGNYRLDFLNVSDTNNMSLNKTCKVNAKYYSISMMDDKNFVVSTIDHIKPFRIVSMSGEEKDFSVQLPSKEYPLGTNFTTVLEKRKKVVQISRNEDKIYIYDIESGEKVVITDNKIKSPGDVAVGPYDHVFVGSSSSKCLVEMTPGGRVLSSHQVDMDYPRFIAISKDKKLLAVSNSCIGARKLSLYKIT